MLDEIARQKAEIMSLGMKEQQSVKALTDSHLINKDLKRQIDNLKNLVRNKEVHIETLERIIEEVETRLNNSIQTEESYKARYGEIVTYSTSDEIVGEWDEDKGFFDHIEKIKGNSFNSQQLSAVRYRMEQNLRIIAGAGSGKTETICAKAAYLIMMESVPQSRICMVTFTRKAADEMRERVEKFLGEEGTNVYIGTFHSIFKSLFNQLIKRFPSFASVGVVGEINKKSTENYEKLLRSLIKKYRLSDLDKYGDKLIKDRVNYWTSLTYSPTEMRDFVAMHYNGIDKDSEYLLSERFYDMLIEFNEIRVREKLVVFDDFLLNLYYSLQKFEAAREFIWSKFDYMFVDEFQDINPLQMEILKLICPPQGGGPKLIIVGDDDQSIYAFRGSDPDFIKEFHEIYSTKTIELMTNYRSKHNIVTAGNRIISENNNNRILKSMTPFHDSEGEAFVWAANDATDEANWIITKAQELGSKQVYQEMPNQINYKCSTVLYRSVGQLQNVYQVLDERNIPYVIESKEDVLGIFNISNFKYSFNKWLTLFRTNNLTDELALWSPILNELANSHYISNNDFNRFIRSARSEYLINDFLQFVEKNKPRVDTAIINKYLLGLMEIRSGRDVEVIQIVGSFFEFPVVKKEMTKEEIDWITKEVKHYRTWGNLISYYERLKDKSKQMKERLEEYNKGKYNALCFMTIHKSKGLAFDNVFVMGVYEEGLPAKKAKLLNSLNITECKEKAEPPPTIEEERRLMYVAVTRAKHNLYVTFPKTTQGKAIKRSSFIKHLGLQIRNG